MNQPDNAAESPSTQHSRSPFEQQLSNLQPSSANCDQTELMYWCGFAAGRQSVMAGADDTIENLSGKSAPAQSPRASSGTMFATAAMAACLTAVAVGPLAFWAGIWGARGATITQQDAVSTPVRGNPAPPTEAEKSPPVVAFQADANPPADSANRPTTSDVVSALRPGATRAIDQQLFKEQATPAPYAFSARRREAEPPSQLVLWWPRRGERTKAAAKNLTEASPAEAARVVDPNVNRTPTPLSIRGHSAIDDWLQ